ncbi:MAG: asparagine synthase (glutamine-hydrolyzing) [Candidatus Deferrimicrobium sp.]
MCGIVGVFSARTGWALSAAELGEMRDTMVSRGPDDASLDLYRDDRLFVGFGHRRLSIIDLSPRGHQPMSTADGTLSIVFNGEIFNYRELRAELVVAGGHDFRSDSDTEVLLYDVRQWGLEGCLRRIRGMYSFALFDRIDRSLTLVRDPLGVKPLYFSHVRRDLFAFASEIKAILAMPGFERKLNRQSLHHYLTFANAPPPETFFEGVRKLEAGCYLKLDPEGRCEVRRYWNPLDFRPSGTPLREEEYVEEIRRLLRQAVSRRMVSDVPFGVFLSGGVDSTLNVALMAELLDRPVETFSIGIEGDPRNEFGFARSVAERFGANHHEMMINDNDFLSFLPKMSYHQDEPLADPVCVPLFYISRLAREAGTPVIQVGEGSDEIFGEYTMCHYFARLERHLVHHYERLPRSLKTVAYLAGGEVLPVAITDGLRRALPAALLPGKRHRLLGCREAEAAFGRVFGSDGGFLHRELEERMENGGSVVEPHPGRAEESSAGIAADASRQDEHGALDRDSCSLPRRGSRRVCAADPVKVETKRRRTQVHPQEGGGGDHPPRDHLPAKEGILRLGDQHPGRADQRLRKGRGPFQPVYSGNVSPGGRRTAVRETQET